MVFQSQGLPQGPERYIFISQCTISFLFKPPCLLPRCSPKRCLRVKKILFGMKPIQYKVKLSIVGPGLLASQTGWYENKSIWSWIAQNNSAWPDLLANFQFLLLFTFSFQKPPLCSFLPHNENTEVFLEQHFEISAINSTDYYWGSEYWVCGAQPHLEHLIIHSANSYWAPMPSIILVVKIHQGTNNLKTSYLHLIDIPMELQLK